MSLAHPVEEVDEVIMVGEDEDLSFLTQLGEDRKQGLHPLVVKGHEEVVENQRHGRMVLKMEVDGGQPQGQKKLVPGPFGQALGRNFLTRSPDRQQADDIVIIRPSHHPFKGPAGHGSEKGRGPPHHRALNLFPPGFDLIPQKGDGVMQLTKTLVVPRDRRAQIGRLLTMVRRLVARLTEHPLLPSQIIERFLGTVAFFLQGRSH